MTNRVSDECLDRLFREARSHYKWLDKPVTDETLRELYDLMKWAPTSMNGNPARIIFLTTPQAKQKLLPALAPGNVEKAQAAPVTAIIAYDLQFYENLPKLFPHNPKARDLYANAPSLTEVTARRNSSLQGAYFILAARALGLDCGAMSGFDNAKVDQEFFQAGEALDPDEQEFFTTGAMRSNFLCNIGYADHAQVTPRLPRLDFDEACVIL